MTMLQAPLDLSTATRVGNRVYRKQVLARRTIDYPMPDGTTVEVKFDDAFLADLAQAYQAGAYDLVPFQLATGRNEHNEDPRNYGGRVIGAEVTPDGLDVILELSEEAAELVERTGRKLGVSARIKAVRHVDGRTFPRAIRHVLGTLDGRMTGMRDWQPVVDLAADDREPLLDLSSFTTTPRREDPLMGLTINLANMSDEELEQFRSFAALNGLDLAALAEEAPDDLPDLPDPADDLEDPAAGDEPGDEDTDEPGDDPDGIPEDEFEALVDATLADMGNDRDLEGAGVSLSTGDDLDSDPLDALDLAAPGLEQGDQLVTERRKAAGYRAELAARDYVAAGVPPHLVDLAMPVLGLSDDDSDALDLSNPVDGTPVDVRGTVTRILDGIRGTIDLSDPAGTDDDGTAAGDTTEDEAADQILREFGLD